MPAERLHLVRHGEVHNPGGVLYGRLPHFHLSERGVEMAQTAAKALKALNRPIAKIVSSPLLRTQQSAEPIAEHFGLDVVTDQRLIEPHNVFEGRKLSARHLAVRPHLYLHLRNPNTPSWGESYESIVTRMFEAMDDLAKEVDSGDVVLVTHQLPIWMVHRKTSGVRLAHSPKQRRCGLSSITTFERRNGDWVEVEYLDPAADAGARDKGAV
jgi:broad specificity phosphatase PhoE